MWISKQVRNTHLMSTKMFHDGEFHSEKWCLSFWGVPAGHRLRQNCKSGDMREIVLFVTGNRDRTNSMFFRPTLSQEALDKLKILPQDMGTTSMIEDAILMLLYLHSPCTVVEPQCVLLHVVCQKREIDNEVSLERRPDGVASIF